MKKTVIMACSTVLIMALSGCYVAPRPAPVAYVPPPAPAPVVYAAPAPVYAAPPVVYPSVAIGIGGGCCWRR